MHDMSDVLIQNFRKLLHQSHFNWPFLLSEKLALIIGDTLCLQRKSGVIQNGTF